MRPVAMLMFAALVALIHAAGKPQLMAGGLAPPLAVGGWVKGSPVTAFGRDKVYVVEFWATWCAPCRENIPHLTSLAKKYKGKVTFIGVSVWEQGLDVPSQVKKFVAAEGRQMDYHVARDTVAGTMAKTWMKAAERDAIPVAFVVANRRIRWIGLPTQGLRETLDAILSGRYDPEAVAASIAANQAKSDAEFKAFQASYSAALNAWESGKGLSMLDHFQNSHPDLAPSLSMLRVAALLQSDPTKAVEFADAESLRDPSIYLVLISSLLEGSGSMKPNPSLAVTLARRFDRSPQGHNYFSSLMLVRALEADGQRAEAIVEAKLGSARAESERALKEIVDGLTEYAANFGLHYLLPGANAPPIKVASWSQGSPAPSLADGKTYLVAFDMLSSSAVNQLPGLITIQQKYRGEVSLVVVDVWEEKSAAGPAAIGDAAQAFSVLNCSVGLDTNAGDTNKAWLEAAGQRGVPMNFVVSKGKIMWLGPHLRDADTVLEQLRAGTFNLAESRESVAATDDEADLLYRFDAASSPARQLAIVEDFLALFPGHASDDEILDLKIDALAYLNKLTAETFADLHGSSAPHSYLELVSCLLDSGDGRKPDPGAAVVYATKGDKASGGGSYSYKKSLGDAYAANGQRELAKATYRLALALAKAAGAGAQELDQLKELAQ